MANKTKAQLEQELKEMKKIVKELQSKENISSNAPRISTKKYNANDYVDITSMIPNLTLNNHNRSKQLPFNDAFDNTSIMFSDLQEYVRHDKKFFKEGNVYIHDIDAVKQLGLQDVYKNMITPEELQNFFKQDVNVIKEKFAKLIPAAHQYIASYIVEKLINKENIDLNKVNIIDNEYKRIYNKEYGLQDEANKFLNQQSATK